MKTLRGFALAALVAGLTSCHDDPEIVTVVVNVLSQGLSVTADGGSSNLSGIGAGGNGGDIAVTAFGPVTSGTAPTPPADPVTSAAPTGFTTADLDGETVATGNLIIPALTTTADAVYGATNGDVVVSGTLQAGDNGTGQFNITLNAVNGTVYIVGAVRTASVDGTLNGDDAGTITINAARIVVSGILDASGEWNTGGGGGDGGLVTLSADAGALVLHNLGSVTTAGGVGTTTAGFGRDLSLSAFTSLHVFSAITTSGGDANGLGVNPIGGDAGNLTLSAGSAVDVSAALALRGGAVTNSTDGGTGGQGGDVICDSVVHVRVFGSIDQRGGSVTVVGAGVGAVTGGFGGDLLLGQAGGVLSADLGLGTWSTSGGAAATAGNAGDITLESDSGAISVASDFVARGGAVVGPSSGNAGNGGVVRLQNDSDLTGAATGHIGFHPITLLTEGSIDTQGGANVTGGGPGTAGTITIEGGGTITVAGSLDASGGVIGGIAADILIRTSADTGTPVGDILLSGAIRAQGQDDPNGGGNGGDLTVLTDFIPGSGHITSSSTITLSGGTAYGLDTGGSAGSLTMRTDQGDITLSGLITSIGGGGGTSAAQGGIVVLNAGAGSGSILYSAILNVNGGGSTAGATTATAGGFGGNVDLICEHPSGYILMTIGSSISSNGGYSTGAAIGGSGGALRFLTDGQFVSISSTISAIGGTALGATGFGGLGGAVQVHTNATPGGPGGDITLAVGSSINVSGGTGTTAGPARNNAGAGITDGDINLVAVQLDGDGDLATSGANAPDGGIVINSGTITASGLVAGDILFDGRDSSGAAVSVPAPGSILPAPGGGGTTFEGQ